MVRVYDSDADDLTKKAFNSGGTVADHFAELKKLAEIGHDPTAIKMLKQKKG